MTPVWGHPWHGLVKDGQLPLPNGEIMAYPQPSGEPWMCGSTALIKHPGVSPVVRSTEEQALDTANGWQWWDRAIISGNQLYGKAMDGWIYIDPAGHSWNVTEDLGTTHRTGAYPCKVTLTRFGAVGVAPASYSYDVPVPHMGQDSPKISGATTGMRLARFHSSPTGNAAIFEFSVEFWDNYQRWWTWRPTGWIEITLSGPGDQCTIEISICKTRVQTLGTVTYLDKESEPDSYYLENLPQAGSRVVREPPTNGNVWSLLVDHSSLIGITEGQFSDYVVAMFYDEAGGLHELTLNGIGKTDSNDPPLVHTGPTEFGVNEPVRGIWTSERSSVSTLTLTYKLDGAELHSYEYRVAETISETLEYRQAAAGGTEQYRTVDVVSIFSPGGTYSATFAEADQNKRLGGGFWNPWFDFSMPGTPEQTPSRMSQSPLWFYEDNAQGRLDICPFRYCNQVFGVLDWELPNEGANYRIIYGPVVVTPSGPVTLPEIEIDQGNRFYLFEQHAYASRNPVTGEVVRDVVPVCYV